MSKGESISEELSDLIKATLTYSDIIEFCRDKLTISGSLTVQIVHRKANLTTDNSSEFDKLISEAHRKAQLLESKFAKVKSELNHLIQMKHDRNRS